MKDCSKINLDVKHYRNGDAIPPTNQENGNDARRLLCSDWRTVYERPEYYKLILCYGYTPLYSNKTMAVCWFASGKGDIYTIAGTDYIMKDVTHWMPLPSEPICT